MAEQRVGVRPRGNLLERIFHEPKFRVCCLGGPKVIESGSGTDMTPTSRKTRALIGYLCIVDKPVGRERLATLLWSDRGDEQSRASLRQAVYELRSLLGGDHLVRVERDTIAAGDDVGTDVAAILAAARSGNLEQLADALSDWRGDFFEDLPSIDPTFDAWLQSERHRVHESLTQAAVESVQSGIARGEIGTARKIVNMLQQRDGTNEIVLRLGLRLDHLAGDLGALHRRYERFRELLKSELDAAPAGETQRLFHELAAGSSSSFQAPVPGGSVTAGPKEDFPQAVENGASNPTPPSIAHSTAEALPDEGVRHLPVRAWHRIGGAITLGIVILGVVAWVIWSSVHKAAPSPQEPLLAVLPFQNLSDDTGSRHVSDGLAGEIADALQRTTKIHVANTPAGLRSANASAPRALTATHVLSGSVERVGDRIRVIAQLMSIQDDSVVWSHAYDTAIARTSSLQHATALQIAGTLGSLLSSGSLGEARHPNAAAYDHYLNGRRLFLQNYPGAAAAELEKSVRLAPDFANAWATLAASRWLLATNALKQHDGRHDPSMANAARAAAERALKIDPNNGEAHGVFALLIPSTRLQEIETQLEKALRYEPNNAQVLGWHGEFLMYVGRNREALNDLTRAYVLDPSTPSVAPNLVLASLKTGRFEEGKEIIDLIGRIRDTGSRSDIFSLELKYFLYRHDWFGLATWLSTVPDRSSPRVDAFIRLCRETAIAFATHENDKFGRLRDRWRTEASVDSDVAVQFLSALGDSDGALEIVQSAVNSRRNDNVLTDPQWETLFVPDLRALRRDPRFPQLLTQWGLNDYWRTSNRLPDFMR